MKASEVKDNFPISFENVDCLDEELTAYMNKGKFRLAFEYQIEYEHACFQF